MIFIILGIIGIGGMFFMLWLGTEFDSNFISLLLFLGCLPIGCIGLVSLLHGLYKVGLIC